MEQNKGSDTLTSAFEIETWRIFFESAAEISHDLIAPLGMVHNVLEKIPGISEEHRRLLQTGLRRSTDVARTLLEKHRKLCEVRNTFNAELARLRTYSEPAADVKLRPIIEGILLEKQESTNIGRRIDWACDSGASKLTARIQTNELKRVLSNVIDNAIEATTEQGIIEVSLGFHGELPIISVSDNGIGIEEHILERLRDGEQVTSGKLNGNGIGLKHARRILNACGADLEIESRHGAGTRISIIFPESRQLVVA